MGTGCRKNCHFDNFSQVEEGIEKDPTRTKTSEKMRRSVKTGKARVKKRSKVLKNPNRVV